MPFGRHAGKTIADVFDCDPDYLRWAARELDGNAGMAARTFLAGRGRKVER